MLDHIESALTRRRQEQERRNLERLALEANRFELLGRVVSGLIHDLATPLSVAGTHLELMLMEELEKPTNERLNLVLSQVHLCSDVVRSTLGYLRHRSHQHTHIHLSDMARACLELSMPLLRKQSIEVKEDLSTNLPAFVGDMVLVRQAILNLINNACQAMENVDLPHELSLRTWMDNDALCISVQDTGKGIDAKERHRVFDTFYTTKGDKGTGLGLAAVQNIMRRHSGEVCLMESEGRGALFVLRFPLTTTQ
jgi:signal transduction histidine kinase